MAPRACPNMKIKGGGRACPKSRAFEQESPFELGVSCCRKTPPKPLDSYKPCPSPMSEIKAKKDCDAFAVRSRVIRSKKVCCRKTKPRDQKILNTVKVSRLLRHAARGQKKSGSSLDTPHVSLGSHGSRFSFSDPAFKSDSVSQMPSHVSTPRFESSPKVASTWSLSSVNPAQSPKSLSARSPKSKSLSARSTKSAKSGLAKSPKSVSARSTKSGSVGSVKSESAGSAKLKSAKSGSVGSAKSESAGSVKSGSADVLLPLLANLNVASSQKESSKKQGKVDLTPAEHAHFMELLAQYVGSDNKPASGEQADLSPAEHAHFMELLAQHIPEHASIPEEVAINAVDSPHGLSPEQYQDFVELFKGVEDDQSQHVFDSSVRFKPLARFYLQQYHQKHRADITALQQELPGSRAGAWYEERSARPDVPRIEVAALLAIIQEMEGAGTDVSMASRLFKIRAMKPLQNKVPQKWVIYENLRLQRALEYIRRVLALAKIETVADAVRTWRNVRANPEERLMMYYMVGLIEHAIIRQNNDATARALARGEILQKK